ncbi:MAG: polysaccharide deacetylase family protein [Oscillospiraceae bacterium]|nr:polysaccharide deacetylase family protein [Oscillospiraceae bacterium]
MQGITKKRLTAAAIIILSVLFLASAVTAIYFVVKYRQSEQNITQLNDRISKISEEGEEYSSKLDSEISEKESLIEENSREQQSYEDRLNAESSEHQSVVDELNKKIDNLNKQLAAKKKEEQEKQQATVLPTVSPNVQPNGKTVYLTFDDGPSPNTPAILDILDRYGVKATFFVINGKYNEYMKDIVDRGHQIALHSYTHNYAKIYSSDKAYFEDLEKIHKVVLDQTGCDTKIIRFPGGTSNTVSKKYSKGIMTRLSKSVTEQGYVYFDWNCSNGDATGKKTTVKSQVETCSQYPKSSSTIIVLMHDTADKKTTVEALPKIIEYYQNEGMNIEAITPSTPPVHHKAQN